VMSHFGDVPKKVRMFSLKKLFLKRFTVRSTTRTLITDKTDHSAFTAIFLVQLVVHFLKLYVGCMRKWSVAMKIAASEIGF
jgi:hypothetical protein